MTQIRDPRLRALLAQAERNANYGKNAAAEMMYRQIVDEAPEAEEGWLGLARVASDAGQKRAAYERALELAPESPAAVAGLAVLDGRPVPPRPLPPWPLWSRRSRRRAPAPSVWPKRPRPPRRSRKRRTPGPATATRSA